ncbi:MAG TPA: hypothetical protein VHA73_12045 [Acidimicrobiales bacterium]|nr:hypothetical protein [Acidimicrobiales bacterium]
MDREAAIDQLPVTYRRLHLWLDAGVPDGELADRLGVPVEALPGLISVAQAKLDNLLAAAAGDEIGPGPTVVR